MGDTHVYRVNWSGNWKSEQPQTYKYSQSWLVLAANLEGAIKRVRDAREWTQMEIHSVNHIGIVDVG